MDGSNFFEQFLKRVTQEHSCKIILQSDQQFWRKFFYEFLHVCIVQEAPIHQSHVYGSKFGEQLLKRVTQGTLL